MSENIAKKNNKINYQKGSLMIYLIIVIFIFIIVMFPVIMVFSGKLQLLRLSIEKEEAMQIADAGINYYQWHLAHFPNDYQDGTGAAGPYNHTYVDYDTQQTIGTFQLTITPPLIGSTVATVQSTGWTSGNPGLTRTVTARFGIPSLAKFAFLSQSNAWIYASDKINGLFMCNSGIRFEGTTNAPVQSAQSTYTCDLGSCGVTGTEPGIWASAPQSQGFWQFPVPAVDFSSLTSTLAGMKTLASSNGIYLAPSGANGYSLVFNSDGTVSIYIVNSLKSEPLGWYYVYNVWTSAATANDYNTRTILTGYDHHPLPLNGIIYIEDNTWVEGTINGRVTVAAALLPYTTLAAAKTIYVPNNIVYQIKDGTDVLALIAQRDIIYSYSAPSDLEVDAAEITQYGSTQAEYYSPGVLYTVGNTYLASYYPLLKHSIKTYGSIMSYDGWNWTWSNSDGSVLHGGFAHTENDYDANLLYSPAPNFPISSSSYQMLSWTSN